MIAHLVIVLFAVGLLSLVIELVTHTAVSSVRRRTPSGRARFPISVLKPLKGDSRELFDNLASFARQDYPAFELVLGCEDASDPALATAHRLKAAFPEVPITVVAGGRPIGQNPKVNNLKQLSRAARHEHWLISDADVRVGPGYLRAIAAEMADPEVGLVSSVIAGVAESTLGASLDNLHLNTVITRSVCGADVLAAHACVIGKSMLFRRADFERLGGWAVAKDVLAEDYVLGRAFQAAGHRVALSPYVIHSVNPDRTVRDFAARHVRWGQMRRHLAPRLYVGEPLLLPSVWFLAALALERLARYMPGGVASAVVWSSVLGLVLHVASDAVLVFRLRGRLLAAKDWVLVPLRDVIIFGVWLVALFRSTVSWRGNTFAIGAGSVLRPVHVRAPTLPAVEL